MSTNNFYSSVVHKHHYENPEQAIAVYTDRVVRTLRGFGLTPEDMRGKAVHIPGGPFEALVFGGFGTRNTLYSDVDAAAVDFVDKTTVVETGGPICAPPEDVGGPFDYVYCVGVLNHVSNPKTFLRDMYQTLAPGGQILISCYRAANRGRQMVRLIRDQMPKYFDMDTVYPSAVADACGYLGIPPNDASDIVDDIFTPIWRAFHNHEFAEWLEGTGASVELLDPDNAWHENMRVRITRPL